MSTRTINCTNGSIKDGSKTVTCRTSDKDCFPDSYTYCKKLSTSQIVVLAAIGVAGLCVLGLVNWILSKLNSKHNSGLQKLTTDIQQQLESLSKIDI